MPGFGKEKMRTAVFLALFLIFRCKGQDDYGEVVTDVDRNIRLCLVCTCSEIADLDSLNLVLNVQCTELDKIGNIADLDKIEWPENVNGLKISATFDGLGITTLGKLPPNSQVELLSFSNNAIKTYWPDPFSDVPNLRKLSFAQNKLAMITPDLFTKIDNLEDLDLSGNQITELNPLDFKSLHHVRKLNLQSNRLNKIPVNSLHSMVFLEDLDLSRNGIYDLIIRSEDGEVMKNLKRLNLSGNRIRSVLKDSFPVNNSIELLDLSNNLIEIVEPDSFLTFANLRELNLAQNNITLSFALPPTLQIAIMKINTLFHWPRFPEGITCIDLSYNRLSEMSGEGSFDNLEVLNIGGNQIKELTLKKLPQLFSLDISYNLFSEIPKALSGQILPNLRELRLDGNPLESVYFKNIISLESLYMSELNNLKVVEDKAFSNVMGRSLGDVTSNKSCFSLYLSNCPSLGEIQNGAFDGTSLCSLDISHNNLSYISEKTLAWSDLSGADLQHNPWRCDCELQWLLATLLPRLYNTQPVLLDELRCGSPRGLAGMRLVHWLNWTQAPMCNDDYTRSDYTNYSMESSTLDSKVTPLTLILAGSIIIALLIAISLTVYLVKSRRRHRIRQAALNRKRQSALDARNSNGAQKEPFSAFNKV